MTQQRAEQLRLFVACTLPDDVLRGLSSLQDAFRRTTEVQLRWVRREGIHITLKFLGSVAAGRVGEIEAALAAAIDPFEARLRPAALSGFGGSRIRVVWVGLEGEVPELVSLAHRVEGALAPLGFPREKRPFAPHLTLARVPDEASSEDRARLAKLVAEHALPPLPELALTEVHLMRSILGRGGAIYERLATFPQPEG